MTILNFQGSTDQAEPLMSSFLKEHAQHTMLYLADVIQLCAAVLIGLAAAQATVRSLVIFFHRGSAESATEDVRLRLGRWLVLALEFQVAADVLREPMLLLLVATSLLYVTVGSPVEAISMLVAVGVVLGISFVQERRTERTLHALRTLASPRALVLRDGVQTRIPGADVVRDHVVFLEEGDRVPADGQLADTAGITVTSMPGSAIADVNRSAASAHRPRRIATQPHAWERSRMLVAAPV